MGSTKREFSAIAPPLWNILPLQVSQAPIFLAFQNEVKQGFVVSYGGLRGSHSCVVGWYAERPPLAFLKNFKQGLIILYSFQIF